MKTYTQDFYSNRNQLTIYSANTILSMLLEIIPAIDSAIDVGCGVGTWLSVLKDKGIEDIQGVDGKWVDKRLLVIPKDSFLEADLNKPIQLPRRFDLVISLEVAEHLSNDSASDFVYLLTELSDYILFSAAIPFQGGVNHVNERWQQYWVELFASYEYIVYDFIRKRIWNDDKIPVCYRQNILFFVKKTRTSTIKIEPGNLSKEFFSLNIVHPDMYLSKVREIPNSVIGSLNLLHRTLKNYITKKIKMIRQ